MEPRRKRFNWRVSEGVAAELIEARRLAGHRSWDEYFLSLLRQPPAPTTAKHPPSDEMKALRRDHEELRSELAAIRNLLETQEQARQAEQHDRAETHEMLRRFYELLSLALASDLPEPTMPRKASSTGNPVLDAIRSRKFTG